MASPKVFSSPLPVARHDDFRFRHAYSPKLRVVVPKGGPSRTKQSFKDECDINQIMRRYELTGILPGQDRMAAARYLDVSSVDFQQAMLTVAAAKSAFEQLPAVIRTRFDNDPRQLLAFIEDDRNREEAIRLGLVERKGGGTTPPVDNLVAAPSGASVSPSRVPVSGAEPPKAA